MNPCCVQPLLRVCLDVTGRQIQHMNDSPRPCLPSVIPHPVFSSFPSPSTRPRTSVSLCPAPPFPFSFLCVLCINPNEASFSIFFFSLASFPSFQALFFRPEAWNTYPYPSLSIPVITAEYGSCNATHLPYMALILDDRWDGTWDPCLHSSWPSPLPPAPSTPYFPLWTLAPVFFFFFFIHTLHLPPSCGG